MSIRTPLFAAVAATLIAGTLTMPASAADAPCTPTVTTSGDTATLTYTADCATITVPDNMDGKTVTDVKSERKTPATLIDLTAATHLTSARLPSAKTLKTGHSDALQHLDILGDTNTTEDTFTSLDLTGYPNLATATIQGGAATEYDLTGNTKLTSLNVGNTNTTQPTVKLPDTGTLTSVTAANTKTVIIPSQVTNLTRLILTGSTMDTLPWNQLTKLETFSAPTNTPDLTGLGKATGLKALSAGTREQPTTTIDPTAWSDLENLNLTTNTDSLDLTANTKLKTVFIDAPAGNGKPVATLKTADRYPNAENLALTGVNVTSLDMQPWATVKQLSLNLPAMHAISLKPLTQVEQATVGYRMAAINDTPAKVASQIADSTQSFGADSIRWKDGSLDLNKLTGGQFDQSKAKLDNPVDGVTLTDGVLSWKQAKYLNDQSINYTYTLSDGISLTVTVNIVDAPTNPTQPKPEQKPDEKPTTHKVTFDTGKDGSKVDAQTVDDNGKATEPKTPTRDGYTFQGWLLDGQTYDFNQPVTKDITLTAAWQRGASNQQPDMKPTTHTVTFDTGDGTQATTQTVEDGKPITKPTEPTRDGYTFTGWTLDGQTYDFNQPVTHDLTLKATWVQQAIGQKLAQTGIHAGLLTSITATLVAVGATTLMLKRSKPRP